LKSVGHLPAYEGEKGGQDERAIPREALHGIVAKKRERIEMRTERGEPRERREKGERELSSGRRRRSEWALDFLQPKKDEGIEMNKKVKGRRSQRDAGRGSTLKGEREGSLEEGIEDKE